MLGERGTLGELLVERSKYQCGTPSRRNCLYIGLQRCEKANIQGQKLPILCYFKYPVYSIIWQLNVSRVLLQVLEVNGDLFKSIPVRIVSDQSRHGQVMLSWLMRTSLLGLLGTCSSLVKRITEACLFFFFFAIELYCVKMKWLEFLMPSFRNKRGGQENCREADIET